MYKLISAGFDRLGKSLCFKIYLAFGVIYSVSDILLRLWDIRMIKAAADSGELTYDGYTVNADSILFDSAMTMLFAAAVFTAIFLGREHSDGTMRNKLIVGHGRNAVYLSNLVVCTAANIAALLSSFVTALALGVPMMGTDFTAEEIVLNAVCILAASIAVTSFMVMGAMLIHGRAAITAALLLSIFAFLLTATYIEEKLDAPEYYSDYSLITYENGKIREEKTENRKNPYYVSGTQRQVMEFLNEALPVSQLHRMASTGESAMSAVSPVSDGVVLILTTGAGMLIFKKRNIK